MRTAPLASCLHACLCVYRLDSQGRAAGLGPASIPVPCGGRSLLSDIKLPFLLTPVQGASWSLLLRNELAAAHQGLGGLSPAHPGLAKWSDPGTASACGPCHPLDKLGGAGEGSFKQKGAAAAGASLAVPLDREWLPLTPLTAGRPSLDDSALRAHGLRVPRVGWGWQWFGYKVPATRLCALIYYYIAHTQLAQPWSLEPKSVPLRQTPALSQSNTACANWLVQRASAAQVRV